MTQLTSLPRILTLMGSGETSPTMVKVHRSVLDRLGPRPVPAVLLDTPFGFQENANELTLRVMSYFQESLQTLITNASGIDPEDPEATDERFISEELTSNIQRARYVFSGPGSPTYTLKKWENTVVPQLLAEKLRHGGAITFASAAALTLGALTVPVYEIYKVGEDPRWQEGLNLLAELGLNVAVIPHFNNTEGGTHDTRFCYLGERRLRDLEMQMSDEAFVLGIDEHSSCTFDLDAQTATVGGIGVLTIRKDGRSSIFASGETLPIAQILDCAFGGGSLATAVAQSSPTLEAHETVEPLLLDLVQEADRSFHVAVAENDAPLATEVILSLEQTIHLWSSDAAGQDEMPRARASLRSMINEFGQIAVEGLEDPASRIAPFIDLLIGLRALARSDRRFGEADDIRDQLVAMGIELHDTPETTTWSLSSDN